jgi:hypothetical protein
VNRRAIYLTLSLAGFVLPYSLFLPWVIDHGLDLPLFTRELFSHRIGGFLLVGVSCGFPAFLYMREPYVRAVR